MDGAAVGLPSGCRRAEESHKSFWQVALSSPSTDLQVQVAELRPAPTASELIALDQRIPVRIGLQRGDGTSMATALLLVNYYLTAMAAPTRRTASSSC